MELVNAGIKSIAEARRRLYDGEEFYYGGLRLHYDELFIFSGESPYRSDLDPIKYEWDLCEHWKKEDEWYNNINGKVLCWVSDRTEKPTIATGTVYIVDFDGDRFIDEEGDRWKYATPVKPRFTYKGKQMNKKAIADHCRGLASGEIKPRHICHGLCSELVKVFDVQLTELVRISSYPNFSGDLLFPIKSLNKRLSAEDYYCEHLDKWSGKRGQARRKFCAWVADELERQKELT